MQRRAGGGRAASDQASGLKPRRSIRFILFSGEEEACSLEAYSRAHRSELDKAAGVIIYDSGTGKTRASLTAAEKICSIPPSALSHH